MIRRYLARFHVLEALVDAPSLVPTQSEVRRIDLHRVKIYRKPVRGGDFSLSRNCCPSAVVETRNPGANMTEQNKVLSTGNSGDERTPDKTIGQIKYVKGQDKTHKGKGGAGEPQVTDLEPEKQGGIGGP